MARHEYTFSQDIEPTADQIKRWNSYAQETTTKLRTAHSDPNPAQTPTQRPENLSRSNKRPQPSNGL
jgi:hypothetical protein